MDTLYYYYILLYDFCNKCFVKFTAELIDFKIKRNPNDY